MDFWDGHSRQKERVHPVALRWELAWGSEEQQGDKLRGQEGVGVRGREGSRLLMGSQG